MARVSAPDFWEGLYATGGDGWELGQPSPPLVDFVESDAAAARAGGRAGLRPWPRRPLPGRPRLRRRGLRLLAGGGRRRPARWRDETASRSTFEQRDIFTLGRDGGPRLRRGVGVHVLLRHRSRPAATPTCARWRRSSSRAAGCWPASSRCARSPRDRPSRSRAPSCAAASRRASASSAPSRRSAPPAAARAASGSSSRGACDLAPDEPPFAARSACYRDRPLFGPGGLRPMTRARLVAALLAVALARAHRRSASGGGRAGATPSRSACSTTTPARSRPPARSTAGAAPR